MGISTIRRHGAAPRRTPSRLRRVGALGAAFAALLLGVPAASAADAAPTSATVFQYAYNRTTKAVQLTFDADWWSPGNPTKVLDILRANGITSAFGLTGRYAEKYPNQAKQLIAAGHKLINHSYNHPYFTDLTSAQRREQLTKAEAAFRKIGLTSGGWFRAPYGDGRFDAGVNRDLAAAGYYISYDWLFDTTGYNKASCATIANRVRQYTKPGATIVMHLSDESTDTACLQNTINTLKNMGYGFRSPYRSVTKGVIGSKYGALGAQKSVVGAPRTGEMTGTVSGSTAVQWFGKGRIYWRDGVGAHEVHGAILTKFRGLGTVRSVLAYPTTDETATPDGVGRYNHFQGGSIYWSAATAAHEVHGAIRSKWAALGWEAGFLRYPVSDEVAVVGGRASQFQGGNVYWSAATAAHEVHGAILQRYLAEGGTGGDLGLPTSDAYSFSGGKRSDFQGGYITWDAATGKTTVVKT